MKNLPMLTDQPKSDTMNTIETMVYMIFKSVMEDKSLKAVFVANPASYFANAGLPILDWQDPSFNDWFNNELKGHEIFEQAGNGVALDEVEGIGCKVCKVASWSIATLIVAVGALGLTYLTAGSAVVVALASFAGVTAEASLAFIASLSTSIGGGVAAVANAICDWTGACS